jgi:predicted RNase H-like nuclease (RuvC/YqgF family)
MEEVQQKGKLNQTAEQLSIFINKNAGEYNAATMPATDDKRMTKKLELNIV